MKPCERYLQLLEDSLRALALKELNEFHVNTSSWNVTSREVDPDSVDITVYEAELNSPLKCFFETKQRTTKGIKEDATIVNCATAKYRSDDWVRVGAEKKAEAQTDEERAKYEALYQPFDASFIDVYAKWCYALGQRRLYSQQAQWATFFLEFIYDHVREARQPHYYELFKWCHISAILHRLPCPSELMAMRLDAMDLNNACKQLDKVGSVSAVQHILDIWEMRTKKAPNTLIGDISVYTAKLYLIGYSLWMLYRYYIPRQLTYSVSGLSTPRHATWTELLDLLLSENVVSFLYMTEPFYLRYIALFGLLLKRRPEVMTCTYRAISELEESSKDPICSMITALETSYQEARAKFKGLEAAVMEDFLLRPLSNQILSYMRHMLFECYYKLHSVAKISTLIDELYLDPDTGEKIVVDMIKNTSFEATIDSAKGTIMVKEFGRPTMTAESTRSIEIRCKFLVKALERQAASLKTV